MRDVRFRFDHLPFVAAFGGQCATFAPLALLAVKNWVPGYPGKSGTSRGLPLPIELERFFHR